MEVDRLSPRVCLIVDNPLRDLDGLVLVAWQLAQRGAEVWLVPMYDQGFDVFAIQPDVVLSNYLRPNNLDLLRLYRRAGIRVGILDTEGAGGKTAEHFAEMVARAAEAGLANFYCVWGEEQFNAMHGRHIVPDSALRLTGCPRYDYCAEPWRHALPVPKVEPGYILINTNFPVLNPRFSSGAESERRTSIQAGHVASFVDDYIRDAKVAHAGMVKLIEELLVRFPDQRFVLRPHPFESTEAYDVLAAHANFMVRQEGTSVEWINQAALLLHLNCSTAVEAVMLGKEPISPAWLDTSTLRIPGPHQVSRHAASLEDMVASMHALLSDPSAPVSAELRAARQQVIGQAYHIIDGQASARTAEAIMEAAIGEKSSAALSSPSGRGTLVHGLRRVLGYRMSDALRRRFGGALLQRRRDAKSFSLAEVSSALSRLSGVMPTALAVSADTATPAARPQMASGAAVCIMVRPR